MSHCFPTDEVGMLAFIAHVYGSVESDLASVSNSTLTLLFNFAFGHDVSLHDIHVKQ